MADSRYVIEIASQLSGVDATAAQLDSLAGKLSGSGAKAAMFEDAIASLAGDLDRAKAATSAANAALSEAQAHYAQLEADADRAAQAVERMSSRLVASQSAAAAAQGKLDAAVSSGAGAATIAKLSAGVDRAAASLRKASAAASGLGSAREVAAQSAAAVQAYAGKLDAAANAAKQAAAAQNAYERTLANTRRLQGRVNETLGLNVERIAGLRASLGNIGGPLGALGSQILGPAQAFAELSKKFSTGTALMAVGGVGAVAAIAAVVAAVAVLSTALIAGVASLLQYGIAASDAARTLGLTREAAATLTPALRGVPWDEIIDGTGVAESALQGLARKLLDAKVSAADLPKALRAAAIAESALGQGGADKFIEKLKRGQITAEEFARTLNDSFGDNVERKMLSLEAQSARFQRQLHGLFSGPGGLNIEPALEGLSVLVSLFDKNTVAGRAMQDALKGILQPFMDQALNAAYVVEAFVLGVMIGATKLYIMLKPAIDAVSELFGVDTDWELEDALSTAAEVGEVFAAGAAIVIGILAVLGAAFLAVVAVVLGVPAAFVMLGRYLVLTAAEIAMSAIAIGASVLSAIEDAVSGAIAYAASFLSIGSDLVAGLAEGITSGTSAVVTAITGVVTSAIDTAKSLLGIASPSKVFGDMGENSGESFATKIEDAAPAAQSAIADLTDTSSAAPGATSTPAKSNTSSTVINIARVEFPGGAEAVSAFSAYLEGLALQGATS